ncbi:hypothetical protein HC928_02300 [bacterium]|nr:hypothetical protein [bacterium]
MNIFVLDYDAKQSAVDQCDKHVVKMPTETAQMLSTNVRVLQGPSYTKGKAPILHPHTGDVLPIMQCFGINHPATRWARESFFNFRWLSIHGKALCREFEKRFGKRHRALDTLEALDEFLNVRTLTLPDIGRTEHPQCMPEKYKHADAVTAYRSFYTHDKVRFAKWSYGPSPEWW